MFQKLQLRNFDEVTRAARQHFQGDAAMKAYFDLIHKEAADYHGREVFQHDPDCQERQKMIEKHPAMVALSDLIDVWNFLRRLLELPRDHAGTASGPLPVDEMKAAWFAGKALQPMLRTPPGSAVIRTLAHFFPVPKLRKDFATWVLSSLEGWDELLGGLESFFREHGNTVPQPAPQYDED